MNKQPVVSTEIKPYDDKDWDETEELEVMFTITTKDKVKVFKGVIHQYVRINNIE